MKPPPFVYHLPDTTGEACELKSEYQTDARVLAGGQSLIPLMGSRRLTPRVLIDIKRISDLQTVRRENGSLVLAAAVRQSRLHDDAEIGGTLPILSEASRHIGHLETRHRGTVGGSLAHADPVAELPTVAVGLGAQIVVRSTDGERRIPADRFFTGARQTLLEPNEVLVEVHFPVLSAKTGWGFAEIARRHGDPAMATAVAVIALGDDGTAAEVEITIGAVAGHPRHAEAVRAALKGNPLTVERVVEASRAAADLVESEPGQPDVGPTPQPPSIPISYRRRLASTVTIRALKQALSRINGGNTT